MGVKVLVWVGVGVEVDVEVAVLVEVLVGVLVGVAVGVPVFTRMQYSERATEQLENDALFAQVVSAAVA